MPNCHLAIVSEPMARNVLRAVVVRTSIVQTSSMPQLGILESKVMEVLWNASLPLSVREVHDSLSASADLAYTTVMTVLDRLAKKHLLLPDRDGKAWLSWSERSSRRSAILAWTLSCSPRRWWRGSPRVSGHCSDRGSPATEPGDVEAHRGSLLTHDGRCVRRWFSSGGDRRHVGVVESRGEAELSVSHAAEQVRGLRPERLVTDDESIGVELST